MLDRVLLYREDISYINEIHVLKSVEKIFLFRHFAKVDAWDVQAVYKQLCLWILVVRFKMAGHFTEMDGVSRIREEHHIFKNCGGGC